MLRSYLCDFSDAYIVEKGIITVTDPDNAKRNKAVAFKTNAPFINYISKINGAKNWQCRGFGCCNANLQFGWMQQKLQKNNS